MDIKIAPNKLNENEAKLHVDNNQHVYTLIGKNGCGKSSILETIFKDYENIPGDGFLVAYSSGKNERFSRIYEEINKEFLKEEKKFQNRKNDIEGENVEGPRMKTFYFDRNWSQLLIFLASVLKTEGKTREFLVNNNYAYGEPNFNYDATSSLSFNIKFDNKFIKKVKLKRKREEIHVDKTVRGIYFRFLENIKDLIDENYDFETTRKTHQVILDDESVFDVFNVWKSDYIIAMFHEYGVIQNVIDMSSLKLNLWGLSLEDLSDGEFQILTIYAILDLFDKENSIFLFDEIDSHLYYKRIKELRESLYQIKGKVITTTHIPDSILGNMIDSLCLVEKGNIKKNATMQEVINRMSSLSEHNEYEKMLAGKCKYIALMEDQTDWFIFTELLKKFIGEESLELFKSKIASVKCSSGYNTSSQVFGDNKKLRINEFKEYNKNNAINTKCIYCVCDRDALPLGSISTNDYVRVTGEDGKISDFKGCKSYVLARRRKQIENYLLSYTMLKKYNKLKAINNKLGMEYKLKKGKTGDNEQVQNLEIKNIIKLLYSGEGTGVDYKKLQEIIDDIPKNEVSDDIMYMYNFINSKLDKCDQQ